LRLLVSKVIRFWKRLTITPSSSAMNASGKKSTTVPIDVVSCMWCLALTLLIYMVLGCCATIVDTTHTGTQHRAIAFVLTYSPTNNRTQSSVCLRFLIVCGFSNLNFLFISLFSCLIALRRSSRFFQHP